MVDPLHSRQAGILPPDRLENTHVAVAGVGAVGSQVVQQLALCGQRLIEFYDPDVIEIGNLYPQGWAEGELGQPKVDVIADRIGYFRAKCERRFRQARFPLDEVDAQVIFLCVDSMDARREIYEAYRDSVRLLIDTRVAAETIRVVSCCGDNLRDYYPSTLFRSEDAFQGQCTTRMTLHHANLAAAIAVQQYSMWLRDLTFFERDVTINARAMELSTG